MKKLKNLVIILLLLLGTCFITLGILYVRYTGSVDDDKTKKSFVIETGMSTEKIADKLESDGLINSSKVMVIYLKIKKINDIKAGTYELSSSMKLTDIIKVIQKGNSYNANEISITFKEGITMRDVAKTIANNTNNTYDEVMNKVSNKEYLKTLIEKYWFITDEILNSKIYYPLEGYLFPDTYRFKDKDVSIEDIFTKLLDEMDEVLTEYKASIEKNRYSLHQLLTLASIAEKEVNRETDRKDVVGVFINRLEQKISLGSDVTTRYSLKLDKVRPLTKKEYATVNAYNTRSSTLAGKLPASPIATISKSSIEASINPNDNEYIYFISNIKTDETFFYKYSKDFEKKKAELANINNGY